MKAEWTNNDSLTTSQTTKAIVVVDMPRHCAECQCCYGFICFPLAREMGMWAIHHGKPVDCPLKPIPSKKVPIFDSNNASYDEEYEKRIMYEIDGYNRCIDEIMGETE